MSECQFVKIMTASLNRSKLSRRAKGRRAVRRWSLERLVAEIARIPDASPHVRNPKKPIVISGCAIEELIPRVKKAMTERPAPAGRKQRKIRPDQHVIICVVASYPVAKDVIEASPDEKAKFEEWAAATNAHQREYWHARGAEPLSTILHQDESFYHLHIFLIPSLVPSFSARAAHPGCEAWRTTYEATRDSEAAKAAYIAAMEEFQNEFFLRVSSRFGHQRFGNRYVRQTRAEAIKTNERRRAEVRLLAERESDLARRAEIVATREKDIAEREDRLRKQRSMAAKRIWTARAGLRDLKAASRAAMVGVTRLRARLTAALGNLPKFISSAASRSAEIAQKLAALPNALEPHFGVRLADKAHGILSPVANELNELSFNLNEHMKLLGQPAPPPPKAAVDRRLAL